MANIEIFRAFGAIVIAAAGVSLLTRFIRLPSIVAYLLAGLLLGPLTNWVRENEAIHLISEIGIVLLLFIVGLELSIGKIRDVGRVAVLGGLGQVGLTAACGYGLSFLLGFSLIDSLFVAFALTFSSTVVVVKILSDKDELDSLFGRIAVGIFLMQDLVVIIVLTVLSGIKTGGADVDVTGLALGIGKAFGGMLLLLAGVLLISKSLLPKAFGWASRSPTTVFIWSLFWCFAVVNVAEKLHLSIELGAFFAGLSLAQLPNTKDLQHRIKPLMNFFVAIFFVSLGLQMTPAQAAGQGWIIAALAAFVLLIKPLILLLLIPRFGYSERSSFMAGITLAQISEFSFIFIAMGASAGLLQSEKTVTLISVVGMITIAISAYMMMYNEALYRFFKRLHLLGWMRASQAADDRPKVGMADHIIIVGMNTLGRKLAQKLHAQGEQVVAVDTDPRKLRGLKCHKEIGNIEFQDVLDELGLGRAKLVISALQIEEANDLLAYRCNCVGVPSAIHAFDLSVVENLLEQGVDYLILPKVDGIKLQTETLKERKILTT
ncbi:MAG: cation:proton antiporter [Chthoniobacterales bacterium]